jgi:hypothetical protein
VWLQVAPLYVRDDSDTELFSADFTALMEDRLDAVASRTAQGSEQEGSGDSGAAETWERWRDEVRDLHEIARGRKETGAATPRTRERLERLLDNAPPETRVPSDLESLTEEEARDWLDRLREAGVMPAPTVRQLEYLKSMVDELDFTSEEAAELIDLSHLDEVRTSSQASALIEELSTLRDERRPPSRKQLSLIERLRSDAGMSESDAAAIIGHDDLDGLTGAGKAARANSSTPSSKSPEKKPDSQGSKLPPWTGICTWRLQSALRARTECTPVAGSGIARTGRGRLQGRYVTWPIHRRAW